MPKGMLRVSWASVFLLVWWCLGCESVSTGGASWGINYADDLTTREVTEEERIRNFEIIRDHGIRRIKLWQFDPDKYLKPLKSVFGGDVEVTLQIRNKNIKKTATDDGYVQRMVDEIAPYLDIVRYVSVGNEPEYQNEDGVEIPDLMDHFLPAFMRVRQALSTLTGGEKIGVTTPWGFDAFVETYPPSSARLVNTDSNGVYSEDSTDPHYKVLLSLREQGNTPFLCTVYPYFTWRGTYVDGKRVISLPYALGTATEAVVTDWGNGREYSWIYEAQYDAARIALDKAGFNDVELGIAEVGWPTAGREGASIENLEAAYKTFTRRVQERPHQAWWFQAFDEDAKKGDDVEPFWGVFSQSTGTYKWDRESTRMLALRLPDLSYEDIIGSSRKQEELTAVVVQSVAAAMEVLAADVEVAEFLPGSVIVHFRISFGGVESKYKTAAEVEEAWAAAVKDESSPLHRDLTVDPRVRLPLPCHDKDELIVRSQDDSQVEGCGIHGCDQALAESAGGEKVDLVVDEDRLEISLRERSATFADEIKAAVEDAEKTLISWAVPLILALSAVILLLLIYICCCRKR